MRWNYYKLRQLSLLQSAMDSYYKLRQLFYYKVRHGLLQIATVHMYMWVKFTFPYYVEAMHERLSLSCVSKNASVEISLEKVRNLINFFDFLVTVDVTAPIYGDVYQKAPCVHNRHQ